VQVLAFLILRQITLLTPHPSLHTNLKKLYLTFVRNAKFTSLSSLPRIAFMKNCVVEMISLDVATGYQHGFVYIRQLALHLRAAITSGKKEAIQVVRCWQFIHCLDLWCHTLSSLLPSPSLQPLLYPLVEVAMGTLSLQPSPRTVPLRLHLITSLANLAAATETHIPLAPYLLEVMEAHSGQMAPASQSAKPPELSCLLRASSSQLQSRGYQTAILTRAFQLLLQLLASQTHLIAFPELAYPTLLRIRKVMKTTPISWFRQQLKQLVEKVEEVSADVTKARSHVTFAPKDADEIAVWERVRRERGGDSLNRFLATWEKLHSGAEATPINVQPMREKQRESQREEGGGRETEKEKDKQTEAEGGRGWNEEEDVVEDIELSSDSELSSD
jgi:nucleolar complex protein 2